ncbi:hypothetical protein BGX30_008524, partial [Mortierella sp. GBA39]
GIPLACPIFDKLQSLTIPYIFSTKRYLGFVHQFESLEKITFSLNLAFEDEFGARSIPPKRTHNDDVIADMMLFVREHGRLFSGSSQDCWLLGGATVVQVWKIDGREFPRTRDDIKVDNPACPSMVQETDGICGPDRFVKMVYISNIRNANSDDIDDVVYGFSQTLYRLLLYTEVPPSTTTTKSIRFGSGWVDLPFLTTPELKTDFKLLIINHDLPNRCSNVQWVNFTDRML